MSERWVNAVIEVTVALDIDVDADIYAKQEAVGKAMERLADHGLGPDMVMGGRWEIFEDEGEGAA